MRDIAYYDRLPVCKASIDLTVAVDAATRQFPRHHKYLIARGLRRSTLTIVQLVARANQREYRAQVQAHLCAEAENLKVLVNVAKEIKAFPPFAAFAAIAGRVVEAARQSHAWCHHSVGKQEPEQDGTVAKAGPRPGVPPSFRAVPAPARASGPAEKPPCGSGTLSPCPRGSPLASRKSRSPSRHAVSGRMVQRL